MSTQPNYGKVFAILRNHAGETWQKYTHHPFVEGLADGSLPRAAFLHYLRQDYVFLIHFSRAWALVAVKSEHYEELIGGVSIANALISEEMQLHIEICEAAGIPSEELLATKERSENLAYTRFVLETGFSGDLLDLLTALMPCVMGYGEIGLRLQQHTTADRYNKEWIETYAGVDYQNVARSVGELVDGAFARRLGLAFEKTQRFSSLCERFLTATQLETEFWQMGLTP